MTESEWLASEDPPAMLHWNVANPASSQMVSDRKLRLFACACWRSSVPGGTTGFLSAVAELDEIADGKRKEFSREMNAYICSYANVPSLLRVLGEDLWEQFEPENHREEARRTHNRATSAALLGEIVGNPFRPVALPFAFVRCAECGRCGRDQRDSAEGDCPKCGGMGNYCTGCHWLTPDVIALAQHAYVTRDFEALPVLADALEDAGVSPVKGCIHCGFGAYINMDPPCGCTNTEILLHLRGPDPHVCGCWALDLILGKE